MVGSKRLRWGEIRGAGRDTAPGPGEVWVKEAYGKGAPWLFRSLEK